MKVRNDFIINPQKWGMDMFLQIKWLVICAILLACISCSDSSTNSPEESSANLSSVSSSSEASSSADATINTSSSVEEFSSASIVSFTDTRDGNTYKTIRIGRQNWFAENLRFIAENGESYCYEGQANNCNTYGRLYNYNAAMASCPTGWHLPTAWEWNVLIEYAGGYDSGRKALAANSGLWNGFAGADTYGFAMLPAGYLANNQYGGIPFNAFFWSATVSQSNPLEATKYNGTTGDFGVQESSIANGYSVRCIEGLIPEEAPASSSSQAPSSSSGTFVYTDTLIWGGGYPYPVVAIGGKEWMAKNYAYGTNGTSVKYNNDVNYRDTLGMLYTYAPASTRCPDNWHLPTKEEWVNMLATVGTSSASKLKTADPHFWNSNPGINYYGFDALPAGSYVSGVFSALDFTVFWSATENPNAPGQYFAYKITSTDPEVQEISVLGTDYYSVRCVKD